MYTTENNKRIWVGNYTYHRYKRSRKDIHMGISFEDLVAAKTTVKMDFDLDAHGNLELWFGSNYQQTLKTIHGHSNFSLCVLSAKFTLFSFLTPELKQHISMELYVNLI